jgi:GntR family transcriptional regulator
MADPMYRQIADDLRNQIEARELAPGAQLPTEVELRDRYDASRNTVRDAIKSLISLGLVETRPGQGTYVTRRPDPLVTTLSAEHREPTTSEPDIHLQTAVGEIAARLRVPEGTALISRHQQRFIDDRPWSLQTYFYPRRLAMRLLDDQDIEEGTVKYLEKALGLKQIGWRDMIVVRAPDQLETSFFKLPDDGRVPVIETRRTVFDSHGSPVWLSVSVYPVDRNSPRKLQEEAEQVQRRAFLRALIWTRLQQKRSAETRSSLSSLKSDPLSRQTSTRDRMTASSRSVRGPTFAAAFWPNRGTAIAA